jgi:hypothetical protein
MPLAGPFRDVETRGHRYVVLSLSLATMRLASSVNPIWIGFLFVACHLVGQHGFYI